MFSLLHPKGVKLLRNQKVTGKPCTCNATLHIMLGKEGCKTQCSLSLMKKTFFIAFWNQSWLYMSSTSLFSVRHKYDRAKYPNVDPLTIYELRSIFIPPISRLTSQEHDVKMILMS